MLADISFSTLVGDGITLFGTVSTAVFNNPVMSGVIMFGIVVSMVGLVWTTFRK